jgi:phosphohistidine phosphatase SixA
MKTYLIKPCAIIIALFVAALSIETQAQQLSSFKEGVIYLVRHGEKDTSPDPGLSTEGLSRSGDLLRIFKSDKKLKKPSLIFVTQYRRTQLTGDSLRIGLDIDTVHYKADTNGDAFMNMLEAKKENKVLVIGHSNTIPVLLRRLGVDYPSDIPDNEYDNFFTVTFKDGKPTLNVQKYGKLSRSGATSKMPPLQ